MNKDIQDIENLYPIDSNWEDTNRIGKKLLITAIEEYGWRNLPSDLLKIYASKCINEDFNNYMK